MNRINIVKIYTSIILNYEFQALDKIQKLLMLDLFQNNKSTILPGFILFCNFWKTCQIKYELDANVLLRGSNTSQDHPSTSSTRKCDKKIKNVFAYWFQFYE